MVEDNVKQSLYPLDNDGKSKKSQCYTHGGKVIRTTMYQTEMLIDAILIFFLMHKFIGGYKCSSKLRYALKQPSVLSIQ